jgi:hypothetical protein
MRLGDPRSISFPLLLALLALAVVCLPNDGHAQPVPVTDIENAAGDSVLTVFDDGGFAVYGEGPSGFPIEPGPGEIPAEGDGARMMWYPAKAAFRAGKIRFSGNFGDEWDDAYIGTYSVAFGRNTEASGSRSLAMGSQTVASGRASTALGTNTEATAVQATAMGRGTDATAFASTSMGFGSNAVADYATAMGERTTASGEASTAMGLNTEASGDQSTAMGDETTASGDVSTAMGIDTEAIGNTSVSMGNGTEASGVVSFATGSATTASGIGSTAMGSNTIAATARSLSIGRYNDANTFDDNTLFVVGNGSDPSGFLGGRSDALVLDFDGNMTLAGSLTENSDRRLKEQIQPLGTGVLGNLGEIEPVRFQFKDERTHPSGTQVGLIAQEVQTQFPALVNEGASGYLSVSYSKFTAVLLKGLQEQQAEIDRLEAKVNRMDQLEARLAKLEQQDPSRLAVLGGPWSVAALLALGLLGLGMFVQRQQRA